jgi:hypothetical protein
MLPPNHNQDRFFLWGMVLLPIFASCAYVFDAFYHFYTSRDGSPALYEGLLSTIVIVFAYLQYCAPIESRRLRFAYHLLLLVLVETGNVLYLLSFIHSKQLFCVMIFVGWMIWDILFTLALLYCRVYRQLDPYIEVENKHIFHFISRLEVILAIFIPVFINQEYSTITRDNIAFFLLFDFFSEKYEHFHGIWIKSCLYLFVATVTTSVASEWLYFVFKQHKFEYISYASELAAAGFCYIFIIMQFFKFHFKRSSSLDVPEELQIAVIGTEPMTYRY